MSVWLNTRSHFMLPTLCLDCGECAALSRWLSHTRTISHVEFVVTDGVMPSWPVVLLMRAQLPRLLPPKWTQRGSSGSHAQIPTHKGKHCMCVR